MGGSASTQLTRIARADRTVSTMESAAARTLYRYLGRVARRGTGRFLDDEGRVLDAEGIARSLASPGANDRPVVVVYWGADAVAIASLPFLEPAFLASAQNLTFLFDETFGGRVCAQLVERLGSGSVMLALPGDAARFEQLRGVMRRGGSYAFAVDGGGPYFEVGNGVATLARTLKAFVVPLAAVARPALPWVHASRISFPLPGCRTTAAIGAPIDGFAANRHAVVAAIQAALTSLGALVRRPSDVA